MAWLNILTSTRLRIIVILSHHENTEIFPLLKVELLTSAAFRREGRVLL